MMALVFTVVVRKTGRGWFSRVITGRQLSWLQAWELARTIKAKRPDLDVWTVEGRIKEIDLCDRPTPHMVKVRGIRTLAELDVPAGWSPSDEAVLREFYDAGCLD